MGLPFIRMGNGNYLYDNNDVKKFLSKHKYSHWEELYFFLVDLSKKFEILHYKFSQINIQVLILKEESK